MKSQRLHVGIKTFFTTTMTLGVLSTSVVGKSLERYRYVSPILTVSPQEELAAVTLDNPIWMSSPGTPPDIRVVTEDGVPCPHLLRKAGERRLRVVRRNCKSNVNSLQEFPDNRIELAVTLDDKSPFATGIDFITPLKDFERQITVLGIDDDHNSILLVDNALIYDYSRFADVRRCHVPLPVNKFRQFAITISNVVDQKQSPQRKISRTYEAENETRMIENSTVTARPFRMDTVQFYAEHQTESYRVDREIEIAVKSWKIEPHPKKKQSIIEIITDNQPLTGFVLQVDDGNFTRRVTVQIPAGTNGDDDWRPIAGESISRISFRNLQHEQQRITFPERRSRRYRFVIENQDNQPLSIAGVDAFGPVWQAIYIAAADQPYQLYYGADQPDPANTDTAAVRRLLDSGFEAEPFTLGEPVDNPEHRRPGYSLVGLLSSRAFFIVAVVIMVAVMAVALVKATRHLD